MSRQDPQEIIRRCAQAAARREAQEIDRQIHLLLCCGYKLEELKVVHFKNPRRASEVWPKSMLETS